MGRERRVLERVIESGAIKHARTCGWITRKMNGLGFISWPDRLFLPPKMKTKFGGLRPHSFWVEFKRLGEKPTPDQARIHKDLRARGEIVHVCDSKEAFLKVFQRHHYR